LNLKLELNFIKCIKSYSDVQFCKFWWGLLKEFLLTLSEESLFPIEFLLTSA